MSSEALATMLSGGHHNSLGRTVEVVDIVLAEPSRLEELYQCYFDDDEVVRLRTSSAIKRLCLQHSDWLIPYIDRLLTEVAAIDQASTQWTLALLFAELRDSMDARQQTAAIDLLKHNLATHNDWIVLNNTMQVLGDWSHEDATLRDWLAPHLQRLARDERKSVARRAEKLSATLQMR